MSTTPCPKCQTTIEVAAIACPSCGSISCRWVAAGLGVPAYLSDASRPTAALEATLRAALAENLELQRNTPARPNGILAFACTDVMINAKHPVLQLVSSHALAERFTQPIATPGLAFEQEFPDGASPGIADLQAMPEGKLFSLKVDQLDRWENPTANIDVRTDVDAAAHLVARLLVTLRGLAPDGAITVNTWID